MPRKELEPQISQMDADFPIKPSILNIQLSTDIMHTLANLAKLLHKQDFRDGL